MGAGGLCCQPTCGQRQGKLWSHSLEALPPAPCNTARDPLAVAHCLHPLPHDWQGTTIRTQVLSRHPTASWTPGSSLLLGVLQFSEMSLGGPWVGPSRAPGRSWPLALRFTLSLCSHGPEGLAVLWTQLVEMLDLSFSMAPQLGGKSGKSQPG